ncbi:MAG: phosphate ABC transporter permease subunit PstC [Myxococcota bacterium]|nr:phosphate ABC transporter permease subunit PstC [Myxococcota bacterium]
MTLALSLTLLALAALGYQLGSSRALAAAGGSPRSLHSRPTYHGVYVAMWGALPALALLVMWLVFAPRIEDAFVLGSLSQATLELPPERLAVFLSDARSVALGDIPSRPPSDEVLTASEQYRSLNRTGFAGLCVLALGLSAAGLVAARSQVRVELRARNRVERVATSVLIAASLVAILTTAGIVLSLVFEAGRFFSLVSFREFLFGLEWSPQLALRADQVASSGAFGAVPVFAGTLLVTVIAMAVAAPVGIFSAIYLAEYSAPGVRAVIKPMLEVLAGIPTVVYGFFAALTVAPMIRSFGESLGLDVASESALAAGTIMGVMIIPFVSSLSDDVITAVPRSLRDGSLGLGATRSETIRKVVLPAALPGIVGSLLLAVSRAIGETMIVVMAAGLAANLTANPLEAVTTVTVQIVTLLVGDQEFDSAKTLAAFALGLVLFIVTLMLNVIALTIVRRYREQYE